jgi:flagellin
MLSLHTNAAALSAQNSVGSTQGRLSTSMTRLGTGFRINSAMDDAAGLQIATRLKAQTSGMAVAMRNTQNSISLMQTAEGAFNEVTNMLIRMKDLATQAADASATPSDKTAMQAEFDSLTAELSNIVGNTTFGGAKLMNKAATTTEIANAATQAATDAAKIGDGTAAGTQKDLDDAQTAYDTAFAALDTAVPATVTALATANVGLQTAQKAHDVAVAAAASSAAYSTAAQAAAGAGDGKFATSMTFQIGASTSETMGIDLSAQLTAMHDALHTASTGYNSFGAAIAVPGTELTAAGSASGTIDKLQAAIDSVGSLRSALGAASNRLEHIAVNLSNMSTNVQAATGRIMDVDYAAETSTMTTQQMLMQAGTAMLKQSNGMSSMVLSLLQ